MAKQTLTAAVGRMADKMDALIEIQMKLTAAIEKRLLGASSAPTPTKKAEKPAAKKTTTKKATPPPTPTKKKTDKKKTDKKAKEPFVPSVVSIEEGWWYFRADVAKEDFVPENATECQLGREGNPPAGRVWVLPVGSEHWRAVEATRIYDKDGWFKA